MLLIGLISYGQATVPKLKFSEKISPSQKVVSKAASITLHRRDVNSKAVRNFVRTHKNVFNEKWYKLPGGFVARFLINDVDYRVDYDKKGNWFSTIRTYDESKLPKDIRHVVKSSYYDYSIILVREIERPSATFTYVVLLEGKTELINLRITNDEMDEWQKFKKSN